MTQQPAAPPLSVGTLFYVFGERCAAEAGRFGGHTLPSGGKVDAAQLACLVWAASFWNLRQSGALTLAPVERKALGLIKTQHVELAMGPQPVQKSGYEDLIMRAVGSGRTFAHDVVYHWFGSDSRDPEGQALGPARQEMVGFGLAREVDAGRGMLGRMVHGSTALEPVPEAIGPWWEHFTRVHPAWLAFRQTEQALAATLLDTIRTALKNRQESTRDDDF